MTDDHCLHSHPLNTSTPDTFAYYEGIDSHQSWFVYSRLRSEPYGGLFLIYCMLGYLHWAEFYLKHTSFSITFYFFLVIGIKCGYLFPGHTSALNAVCDSQGLRVCLSTYSASKASKDMFTFFNSYREYVVRKIHSNFKCRTVFFYYFLRGRRIALLASSVSQLSSLG